MSWFLTRSIRMAFAVASAGLVIPQLALAQSFVFTPIATDATIESLRGATCVGMNNSGVVIFRGNALDLWRGSGGAPEPVSPAAGSLCASINDLGEIAYLRTNYPSLGVTSLVRNTGGIETILARSDDAVQLDPATTHLPSLNLTGNAVYSIRRGLGTGQGIYVGPGVVKVCDKLTDGDHCGPPSDSMNDSDIAVWVATAGGVTGVYRGSLLPLIKTGDAVAGGIVQVSPFNRPVINNSGTVAFEGALASVTGIYTTDTGASVTLVGTGPGGGQGFSINNSGAVAYRRDSGDGPGRGVFVGRPGAVDRKVIGLGDALDGSTVVSLRVWPESLNDDGQVAFWAHLANDRVGVYRADPQWLGSLTFTQTIPGCGPIIGRVKLATPAPVGGLTIDLANTNPAASVPSSVTVAKGKTAGTFQINPDVVLSKVHGTITATIAAQSATRNLTVRPITVMKLTIAPNPVVGGNPSEGTVQLDCAAPHDITVALSSKTPAVAHPDSPSLLIPAGTPMSAFPITTAAVGASTSVPIKAAAYGIAKSKSLTVTPSP
jgi:hypothetical protein